MKLNLFGILGLIYVAIICGLAIGDIGETVHAKTYVFDGGIAMTIIFSFALVYILGLFGRSPK